MMVAVVWIAGSGGETRLQRHLVLTSSYGEFSIGTTQAGAGSARIAGSQLVKRFQPRISRSVVLPRVLDQFAGSRENQKTQPFGTGFQQLRGQG